MYTRFFMLLASVLTISTVAGQQKCIDSSFTYSYHIPGTSIVFQQVLNTRNGGLLILGRSELNSDAILIELDSTGTTNWSRILKRSAAGKSFTVTSILQLKDGSSALGFTLNDPKNKKIGVIKLDESGNILWQKIYQNNSGISKDDSQFYISAINEGKDGDMILNSFESSTGTDVRGPGITLVDKNGNVRWSFQYSNSGIGAVQLGKNENIFRNGTLVLWGKVYETPCSSGRDFLSSIILDYNTGKIEKLMRYCISGENENVRILTGGHGRDDSFASDVLATGETVVYTCWYDSWNYRMYLKFDKDLNFMSGYRIIPFQTEITYAPVSHGINESDGSLVFSASLPDRYRAGLSLYHYFVYMKKGSEKLSQFYFDDTKTSTVQGRLQFQGNNRINEILNIDGDVIINNMGDNISAKSFCLEAADSAYGYLQPYRMEQSIDSSYQWVKRRDGVYSAVNTTEIVSVPVPVERREDCKKISFCDSLQISGKNSLCLGADNSIQFTATKNPECFQSIDWSADTSYTGAPKPINDSTIEISLRRPGTFKLFATVGGCGITDSMEITVYDKKESLNIQSKEVLCPGNTVTLHATKGFVSYNWNGGGSDDSLMVDHPGMYSVSGTDGCGNTFEDSIKIKLIDTSFNLIANASICQKDSLKIAIPASVKNISWYPEESGIRNANDLILFPQQSETYSVKADFSGECFSQKNITVTVNNCPETIFFPNSFTPNNDGLNDYFRPVLGKDLQSYQLIIFNRYGQKIFASNDPDKGWDGTVKSAVADSGVFTWVCEYRFPGMEKKMMKGVVYLLR